MRANRGWDEQIRSINLDANENMAFTACILIKMHCGSMRNVMIVSSKMAAVHNALPTSSVALCCIWDGSHGAH